MLEVLTHPGIAGALQPIGKAPDLPNTSMTLEGMVRPLPKGTKENLAWSTKFCSIRTVPDNRWYSGPLPYKGLENKPLVMHDFSLPLLLEQCNAPSPADAPLPSIRLAENGINSPIPATALGMRVRGMLQSLTHPGNGEPDLFQP